MRRFRRIVLFGCIVCMLLTASGCVYLRLLKLKKQFREFERYVQLDNTYGLSMIFKTPVLQKQDIIWLMKGEPPIQAHSGRYALLKYEFKKRSSGQNSYETDGVPVALILLFQAGKLYKVRFPQAFSRYLQPELLTGSLRSMGKGIVDKQQRSVSATLQTDQESHAVPIPIQSEIEHILGRPYRLTESVSHTMFYYEYELSLKRQASQRPLPTAQIWLYFDPENERLQTAKASFHGMTTSIQYPTP